MSLLQQLAPLKSGERTLTPHEFDAVYDIFKERMNNSRLEGTLLLPYTFHQRDEIKDATNILELLIEHGFIRDEWIFWEDGDTSYQFYDLDEEELEEINAELEKSKAAEKLYERESFEYLINCGRIVHPEKGTEGFDPLKHLGKHYYFTDKLKVDPSLVEYNNDDKNEAMKQLFPAELNTELEKRAQEIAMKRLGL